MGLYPYFGRTKTEKRIIDAFTRYIREQISRKGYYRNRSFETYKYKFDYKGTLKKRLHSEGSTTRWIVTLKDSGEKYKMLYHKYRGFTFYEFKKI